MEWTNSENNWRGFHCISTCPFNFCSVHEIDCELNFVKTQFHSWRPAFCLIKSTHSVINVLILSVLSLNRCQTVTQTVNWLISSVITGKVRAFFHEFCYLLVIHKRSIVHLISHYSDQTTLPSTMLLELKTHSGTVFLRVFLSRVLRA